MIRFSVKYIFLTGIIVLLLAGTAGVFILSNNPPKKKVLSAKTVKLSVTPIPTNLPTPTVFTPTPTTAYHATITKHNNQNITTAPTIPFTPTEPATDKPIPTINTSYQTNQTQTTQQQQPQIVTPTVMPPVVQDCSAINSSIASIKSSYQLSIDAQTRATNNELGQRGISSDSELYQQTLSSALQPIYSQENAQIAQVCLHANSCPCP